MLKIIINDLPPMPRNRSHQVTKNMLIKTPLAREFEKDLTNRLQEYKNDFINFKSLVSDDCFVVALYTIYTPSESLFTKEGRVSLRAVDTDAHKMMRDTIYKCIGIDDKMERDTRFYTPVSYYEKWNYKI